MAHVVSERRARKLEKQYAEAVVGSEEERDQKSTALKELEEGTFGSEENFFTK